MNDYEPGSVKQAPDARAVAIRTELPDEGHAWLVGTVDRGGHYATDAEVEEWPDLWSLVSE